MFSKDISSVNKTQFKYVCIYSGVWKNRSAFVAVKNFYNKSHLNNLENFSAQNTLKCLLKWARQWSEHSWHTLCFSNKPRKNNRTTQIWISGWLIKERSFWHQMSKEFFAEILLLDSQCDIAHLAQTILIGFLSDFVSGIITILNFFLQNHDFTRWILLYPSGLLSWWYVGKWHFFPSYDNRVPPSIST